MFQGWIKNTVRLGLVGGLRPADGLCHQFHGATTQTNQTTQTEAKGKEEVERAAVAEGVKLHKDRNIQGSAGGRLQFQGHQTLYLTPIVFAVSNVTTRLTSVPRPCRNCRTSL